MKGQRLYVRAATGDREVRDTAAAIGLTSPPAGPRYWIAFLVGDPVAIAGADVEKDHTSIRYLEVVARLQRKRIGTVLLRELEAALPARFRLAVRKDLLPREFLVRNGFEEEATQYSKAHAAPAATEP